MALRNGTFAPKQRVGLITKCMRLTLLTSTTEHAKCVWLQRRQIHLSSQQMIKSPQTSRPAADSSEYSRTRTFRPSFRDFPREYQKKNWSHQLRLCHNRNPQTWQDDGPIADAKKYKRFGTDQPSFKDFLMENQVKNASNQSNTDLQREALNDSNTEIPYLHPSSYSGHNRKVFFMTYGCQMNVNDTEIVWSILNQNHFHQTSYIKEADVVLVMTCAIREGAEDKIWRQLDHLKALKQKKKGALKIGVLGCMAERLKSRIIEMDKNVDLVCGPDAYRDLPRMLSLTDDQPAAVNVQLSLEETYADILPVRLNRNSRSAFVSIMRGCDNMCSYCIVPFTRGRERSRPTSSIVNEVRALSDQGVKEVTLLGQNVNSYCDKSERYFALRELNLSKNFRTLYRPKKGGQTFADLLERVSAINPEMRIRFTSPHPKDFPDEVLDVIKDRSNICNQLHLPVQSGSNQVLANMRRGYTREAYLELVEHIREKIPDVALSSDFIAGFCGETEEDHQETLDLIRKVKYHYSFYFPYSMREKTHAYHRLIDDVPKKEKSRRHEEIGTTARQEALRLHMSEIGSQHLVLVEGNSKRSPDDLVGRNEANIRVVFPNLHSPSSKNEADQLPVQPGDYVVVQIVSCSSQILKGVPLYHSTLQDFHRQTDSRDERDFGVL